MAIQKYKKVENYNLVEDFIGNKIPAFSVILNKTFIRTFCSCGKTFVGLKDRCDCGNNVVKTFDLEKQFEYFKFYTIKETDSDGVEDGIIKIFYKKLYFNTASKCQASIDAKLDDKLLFIISKNNFQIVNSIEFKNRYVYGYNVFVNLIEDELDRFTKEAFENWFYNDLYKDWFYKFNCFKRVKTAIQNSIDIINLKEEIFKDNQIYQYPYLVSYYLDKNYFIKYDNLKDFFINRVCNDSSFMDIINYYLYYICNEKYDSGRSIYLGNLVNNYLKLLNEDYFYYPASHIEKSRDLIKHYVYNHMLTIDEASKILTLLISISENPTKPKVFPYDYKYFDTFYHKKTEPFLKDFFDVAYLDYFEIYLKENVSICKNKENIVYDFIDRIRLMVDNKIPIEEENFKIKNFNWLNTSKNMANEYKLPENKVNLFLDLFETSPIEAIELVSNRKKLTEKQIDNLIDKMSKK